jgi:predicted nucleic acid-binding protein
VARVFIDANIFLYAVGGDGPHREPCKAVLAAVADGALEGVTSTEVLQEILHVRARRLGVIDAAAAVRAAAALVAEVLPVTVDDVLGACDLATGHHRLGARDALHVAVMRNGGITTIVSLDEDFDCIKHIKRLRPEDAIGVAR